MTEKTVHQGGPVSLYSIQKVTQGAVYMCFSPQVKLAFHSNAHILHTYGLVIAALLSPIYVFTPVAFGITSHMLTRDY